MKRITIAMPDDLARAAAREAKRRDTSTSEVIRVALVAHLGLGGARKVPAFVGIGASGTGEAVGARIDELMDEEWTLDSHR
jgi:Ribbon-helix-helix protein, copG family